MKISEYNDMMAYLTRPPRSEQQEASGERVQLAAGASIKYMIDFILKHGPKVSKKGKMPSKEFLEFMGNKNPQNIVNVYEDVKKKAKIIDDPDLLKPKTKPTFEVNEKTASSMAEFMKREDPEGYKQIQKIVDDINQKKELEDFDITDREPNAEGGQVGKNRPTQEQLNKTIKEIQDFVADKKSKGEQIFHKDLEKITGGKNIYLLKKAGVMDDITKLAEEGRGPVQQKVQSIVNKKIDEFYEGNRPISELKPETLNKEIAEEAGLEKIGKRNFSTYLNANEKYREMIPVRNSIDQSIKKQKGPVKEKLQTLTFEEAKGGDVVAKARPELPQPKGVEDSILRDLRRYSVQNKNKGSLFQIVEDSKDYNKLKILDAETGEILDKNKIKKYVKQGDPRFKEYVDTFKDVRKIKNKKYDGTTLNKALKKIKRGGVDASVQLGHVDGVGVNPLKNLEPQLAFANQAARAKGVDFKKLGLQAPGGEGIPRKLTAEENINRFVKFADRSLKAEKGLGTKLYSGFSPELGKLSYEVLKDIVKGVPTLAGATALTAATGGIDPTSAIDRTALGAELAFAPELVKQSARFGPVGQRISNLLLSPKMAMRAARLASPVGIATLGAEGAYQLYQALENEKARIAAMSPEERQRFEEEQTAAAYMGEAEGYAYGGRVELEEGGPPDPGRRKFFKIMGGLASLPILGKIAKPIAKAGPEAVEVISRTAEQMPTYLTALINKIKNFGKSKVLGKPDSPDGAMEYNLGDYTVIEGPGYTRINKSNYGGFGDEVGIRNEIEMEIKKDPETGTIQYEEIEVYPDMDGKMRDVEEGVDDMFHEEMEKFARSDD